MRIPRSFASVILAAFSAAAVASGASDGVPVGFLQSVSGDVEILGGNSPGKLHANTDAGRILFSDETIRCGLNGHAEVRTGDSGSGNIDVCKSRKDWNSPGIQAQATARGDSGRIEDALEKYGKRAGRDKGTESAIYSPPDHGAVIAAKFIVRWRTRPPLPKLTVVLQDGAGNELARVPDVDGAAGILDLPALRDAMVKYRDTAAASHEAKLMFQFESRPPQSVTFLVLSLAQEHDLDQQLAQQDRPGDLFSHVMRARAFDNFGLFNLVAAEYDSALEQAPQSRDLLRAAFYAHARTGDLHRARELRDKLRVIEGSSGN
jgi:hypothetical protein